MSERKESSNYYENESTIHYDWNEQVENRPRRGERRTACTAGAGTALLGALSRAVKSCGGGPLRGPGRPGPAGGRATATAGRLKVDEPTRAATPAKEAWGLQFSRQKSAQIGFLEHGIVTVLSSLTSSQRDHRADAGPGEARRKLRPGGDRGSRDPPSPRTALGPRRLQYLKSDTQRIMPANDSGNTTI